MYQICVIMSCVRSMDSSCHVRCHIVCMFHVGIYYDRWACTPGIAVGVLHFNKGSEFAHDLMTAIAASALNPERGGYDWGRELYTRVYHTRERNAINNPTQQPLPYNYPACYFYPEWCTEGFHDYAMTPDPDEPERPLFLETFTYHWHGAGGQSRYGDILCYCHVMYAILCYVRRVCYVVRAMLCYVRRCYVMLYYAM